MTEDTLLLLAVGAAVPYVVTSLGIVPYVARQRRRSGVGWAILSLLVSPVIALLALAAVPLRSGDGEEIAACPYCAEDVKSDAIVCPHCRSNLENKLVGRLTAKKQ